MIRFAVRIAALVGVECLLHQLAELMMAQAAEAFADVVQGLLQVVGKGAEGVFVADGSPPFFEFVEDVVVIAVLDALVQRAFDQYPRGVLHFVAQFVR